MDLNLNPEWLAVLEAGALLVIAEHRARLRRLAERLRAAGRPPFKFGF